MHNIRELLETRELKIVLESPEKDYRFEYYTSPICSRGLNQCSVPKAA